jgi:L1 cell adhesion molecule like protein
MRNLHLEIIDLANPCRTGTTYSCVANYEGSNVEIIANEQGNFTTPSFVSFTDKERLIGESAKNQAAMNPRNTVFDIKSVLNRGVLCCGKLLILLQAFDRTSI